MKKTRLGVSVGLVGAALFFACFFGGYLAAFVVAGYILLFEENPWLRRTAVRGVALMIGFSVLSAIVGLIPDTMVFLNSIWTLFGGNLYSTTLSNIVSVLSNAIDIIEKLFFLVLGVKALNQGTVRIPVIDNLVTKYMNGNENQEG